MDIPDSDTVNEPNGPASISAILQEEAKHLNRSGETRRGQLKANGGSADIYEGWLSVKEGDELKVALKCFRVYELEGSIDALRVSPPYIGVVVDEKLALKDHFTLAHPSGTSYMGGTETYEHFTPTWLRD